MADSRVIRVFEDRLTKIRLNEQEKKDLLLIRDIIGDNNFSLQADGKLLISHYVGFVQVNKTRVLVYPKIALNIADENLHKKAFDILIKMLAYTGFDQVKRIYTPQHAGRFDGDVLELFVGIFADELLGLLKRDINRGYRGTMENQSFIKGKIDFAEQVKRNSYRRYLHSVRYEEFTEDILMNRLFKTVAYHLLNKTAVKDNRIKLGQVLLWLEDVERIRITNDIWNRVVFTRLNKQYRPVFNMAKLFYYNSSANLNKGDELTFSFMVPLNQLYERYLYEILKNAVGSLVNVKYQGPVRYLGRSNGDGAFLLRPDITLMKDGRVVMILDAKYKEPMDTEGRMLVSQSDIYQMLAYSIRYDCNQVVLVYPKMMRDDRKVFELANITIPKKNRALSIRVIMLDLECDAAVLGKRVEEYIRIILHGMMESGTSTDGFKPIRMMGILD